MIRIGTRDSKLAKAQTQIVVHRILQKFPDAEIEIVFITTDGDRIQHKSITEIGATGVFVKELENALLDNRVDLVVHSLKDLPTELPDKLALSAILNRQDPRDVLISRNDKSFLELPKGSVIATSSRRRIAQLKFLRKDLQFADIRGNIDTRLRKHEEGQCDAIILAAAGIIRLGLTSKVSEYLSVQMSTPAVGQGALAVECRADDSEMMTLSGQLDERLTHIQAICERAFLKKIGGGCSIPVGALATIEDTRLQLVACVANLDGSILLREYIEGYVNQAEVLGYELADVMLQKGAASILDSSKPNTFNIISAP